MTLVVSILENIAYIVAITLQLVAAILLVGNTDTRPEKIIKAFVDRQKEIAFNEDGTLLDRGSLEDAVNYAWTNRIAFSYLFTGYLIGVFGVCTIDKCAVLLIIAVLTCVLFVGTCKFAKHKANMFQEITDKEIPKELDVTIIKSKNTK